MDPMESGLRYRLRRAARQISEQHRHMGQLLREFEEALPEGARDRLMELLLRCRAAIDAHFRLEEDVFFPALHGLHPGHAGELDSLSREHEDFAAEFGRLRRCLEEGRIEACFESFRALMRDVGMHEKREEQLVREFADPLTETG